MKKQKKESNSRIKWALQVVDIKKLKPFDENPRIITEDALLELEKSFDEIGMCQPLVVSNDFSIISGNARYLQLKKEGCEKVQVMVPDRKLTKKQEKAVVIRMNKNVVGRWDFDVLANNYDVIDLMDWGFEAEDLVGKEAEEKEVESTIDENKDDLTFKIECADMSEIQIIQDKFNTKTTKIKFGKFSKVIELDS